MRFKARLESGKVDVLLQVISSLERFNRVGTLHLTPQGQDAARLIVPKDASGSVAVFCSLMQGDWFKGCYRIESQNENHIALELEFQNLARAVKSASGAEDIVLKLAKKDVAVLAFEITSAMGVILQDVPVSVLSPARLAEACNEPSIEADPGLVLPPLTKLYPLVDRIRNLNAHLGLRAVIGAHQSRLELTSKNDTSEVSASFAGLARATMDGDAADADAGGARGPVERAVSVDARQLSKALQAHGLSSSQTFLFFLNQCALLHLPQEGTDISYYIPTQDTDSLAH